MRVYTCKLCGERGHSRTTCLLHLATVLPPRSGGVRGRGVDSPRGTT